MAAHIVKPELLAQEIGQRASVNELAAVIQQPGDIRNGRRLRQRPLDLVLRVHAASMRFARSIVQLYLRVKGRPSRRAAAARPKAQKQTEPGRPPRTPGTSSTLGSLGGSERHGGAVAEAMPALRREPAAKARPGAYGRGAAAASGARRASGEGAPHRVSVSQRGLWALRKGDAGAAARGDQRGLWTAVDGADRLLDGSLPVAAAAGGSHAGRCAGYRDQFGEYPESLGRSQPGGRTARSAVAGAVAARSGPECGGDGVADQRRQALDLGAGGEPVCVLCGGLSRRQTAAPSLLPQRP